MNGNNFKVVYVLGGIVGGLISSLLSQTFASVPGVPAVHAFWGGFLLLLGARIACGCTRYNTIHTSSTSVATRKRHRLVRRDRLKKETLRLDS